MPQFIMVKDKIALGSDDPDSVIDKIANAFPNASISRLDGLKLLWENSWLHIRKSNTEPVIRVIAEAVNLKEASRLAKEIMSKLQLI